MANERPASKGAYSHTWALDQLKVGPGILIDRGDESKNPYVTPGPEGGVISAPVIYLDPTYINSSEPFAGKNIVMNGRMAVENGRYARTDFASAKWHCNKGGTTAIIDRQWSNTAGYYSRMQNTGTPTGWGPFMQTLVHPQDVLDSFWPTVGGDTEKADRPGFMYIEATLFNEWGTTEPLAVYVSLRDYLGDYYSIHFRAYPPSADGKWFRFRKVFPVPYEEFMPPGGWRSDDHGCRVLFGLYHTDGRTGSGPADTWVNHKDNYFDTECVKWWDTGNKKLTVTNVWLSFVPQERLYQPLWDGMNEERARCYANWYSSADVENHYEYVFPPYKSGAVQGWRPAHPAPMTSNSPTVVQVGSWSTGGVSSVSVGQCKGNNFRLRFTSSAETGYAWAHLAYWSGNYLKFNADAGFFSNYN